MTGNGVYRFLLRAYPRAFRAEYEAEMLETIQSLGVRAEYSGPAGRARLWLRTAPDLVRGALAERLSESRSDPERPPYGHATLASLLVLALYAITLAPTTGFWDAGEYITAAHTLGIPHPPGNPGFVLLGNFWDRLLAPLGLPVAVRINLLSAVASAAAHGFWFLVVDRILTGWVPDRTARRVGAFAAILLSATAFTVWNHSNVNEKVYTISLLSVAAISWLTLRWRDRRSQGAAGSWRLVLIVFLLALTASNHLMGVLAAPAVLLFVVIVDARALLRWRAWAIALPLAVLALSVHLFLPYRAAQRPILAEGDPRCARLADALVSVYTWGRTTIPGTEIALPDGCTALSESLTRAQYGKPPVSNDPTVYPYQIMPRGSKLVAAQLLQYAQYFDWQWARSIAGHATLLGGARPLFTLLFLGLGLLGAVTHWRRDRAGAAFIGVLFLTYSLGLVWYLNFKYGYAIGHDQFPGSDMHEVRERDYFFVIGFSVWGLWAACGLSAVWRRLERHIASRSGARRRSAWCARLALAPILAIALLPLALNWTWASRSDDFAARDFAYNLLMSVEPYGVLFTNGDNDTFPLWYLQEVEGIRRDVTVAVLSYMNTPWYLKQLRDLTRPCTDGADPAHDPTRIICQRSYRGEQMPAALLADGVPESVPEPADSAFPLSDTEIDRMADGIVRTERPITYRAGAIQATIPAGTILESADTFVAIAIRESIGERPIHFVAPSPALERLGLGAHAVRVGLTYRIDEQVQGRARERDDRDESGITAGPVGAAESAQVASRRVLPAPAGLVGAPPGSHVDVTRTDTLLRDVFLHRGRIVDASRPWADAATTNMLMQYAFAHLSMAAALDLAGDAARTAHHFDRFEWWSARGTE